MTSDLLEKHTDTPVSSGEDDVRLFLEEIRRYPLLSAEDEKALARRCSEGDEDAIRQMVNSNLRLVVSIAREYAGRGVALLDLIQEGSIGLLAAAKKFDYTLEYRFSTYATKWIRQGVTRCLLNHGSLIRVPVHTTERIRKLESIRTVLRQETGEDPTVEQLARACDMDPRKAEKLLSLAPEVCSLDVSTGDGNDSALGMLLEDVQTPQPQEMLIRRELERTMELLMSFLNDRQRQILRLRFGMEDGVCHSLEEIGKILGISKERVRQIEKQAMEKLQKNGANLGLEDFLNE